MITQRASNQEIRRYSMTQSLLKTIYCFKLFPDALFFKLLHFLAQGCHSFSQSWSFLLSFSQPSHHPSSATEKTSWTLCMGIFSVEIFQTYHPQKKETTIQNKVFSHIMISQIGKYKSYCLSVTSSDCMGPNSYSRKRVPLLYYIIHSKIFQDLMTLKPKL